MSSVLVTYATKYGATRGIAEKIGAVLIEEELQSDILPVKQVKDISKYTAMVLGSAVYIGMWRKEVEAFIRNNEITLSGIPIWIFSSGPTGDKDAAELMQGWVIPPALKPVIDRINPKDIIVFHGLIDSSKMNFFENWAIKNVKAPLGDFRRWDDISAWAKSIAAELKRQA
jgi:menaquinone-dependent protoporphyrinogen oxidase